MQIFNPEHHAGPLLYFDLDTVIVKNIDWIPKQSTRYFWAPRDFRSLWRTSHSGINSSIMWWDTRNFDYVWRNFKQQDLNNIIKKHPGDQDYLNQVIENSKLRFFDPTSVKSWRWQCLDGGYDFRKRRHQAPGTGTQITDSTSIMLFHGNPKPEQITDQTVITHWR